MTSLLLGAILLAGCTTSQRDLSRAQADPWEKSNRRIYAFNKQLDRYAVKPVTKTYRLLVPKVGRQGISNAFNTYGQPSNMLNAVLQGKISQAFRSLDRLLLNASLGVGGLFDVATKLGRPDEPEDFGKTFARWGIKSGPYLVLPLFGPSTLRDGLATPVDLVVYPSDFVRNALLNPGLIERGVQIGGRIISLRSSAMDAGVDGLMAGSLDEYALVRSAYLQRRQAQLWDGNPPATQDPFGDESEPAPAPAPVADPPKAAEPAPAAESAPAEPPRP
jgi:phospholipid-binding lipoprotein MlaA